MASIASDELMNAVFGKKTMIKKERFLFLFAKTAFINLSEAMEALAGKRDG
jgi:hypothetical protein